MAITNSYGTRIIKIYDSAKTTAGSVGSDTTPIPNPANFIKNYGNPTSVNAANTEITVNTATFKTDLENGVFEIGDTYYSPKNFAYGTIVAVLSETVIELDTAVAFTGSAVQIFKRNASSCLIYATNNATIGPNSIISIQTESGDIASIGLTVNFQGRQQNELIPLQVTHFRKTGRNLTGDVHAIFN